MSKPPFLYRDEECKWHEWQPIETAPKDEMFIWAYFSRQKGKWMIGLAYRNVSGSFSDAYGHPRVDERATHWLPLPFPPASTQDDEKEKGCSHPNAKCIYDSDDGEWERWECPACGERWIKEIPQ